MTASTAAVRRRLIALCASIALLTRRVAENVPVRQSPPGAANEGCNAHPRWSSRVWRPPGRLWQGRRLFPRRHAAALDDAAAHRDHHPTPGGESDADAPDASGDHPDDHADAARDA